MSTSLLEQAFAAVVRLSEKEQDQFAEWILAELESEQRWQKSFANSADVLAELAEEALLEHRSGKTIELDPDNL